MHLHAWAVPREIARDRWHGLRRDALAVLQAVSARLERGNAPDAPPVLRGPEGMGGLVITDDRLAFNGNAFRGEAGDPFVLERVAQRGYLARADAVVAEPDAAPPGHRRRAFRRCDTRGAPYDLAVCAVLLTAMWHLGDEMRLGTQGSVRSGQWRAAADLVRAVLGVDAQMTQTEYGSIRWKRAEPDATPGRSAS